jgi:hypothetical protein
VTSSRRVSPALPASYFTPYGAAFSSPAGRWSASWRRRFDTDLTGTPSARAAPAFDIPSARARTIQVGQAATAPALCAAHQLGPLLFRQYDRHGRRTRTWHDRRLAATYHQYFKRDTLAARNTAVNLGNPVSSPARAYLRVRRILGRATSVAPSPRGGSPSVRVGKSMRLTSGGCRYEPVNHFAQREAPRTRILHHGLLLYRAAARLGLGAWYGRSWLPASPGRYRPAGLRAGGLLLRAPDSRAARLAVHLESARAAADLIPVPAPGMPSDRRQRRNRHD